MNPQRVFGMEIGSDSISQYALDQDDSDQIARKLAVSESTIEAMVPGYEVRSLSPPFGIYPSDVSILESGTWEDDSHDFDAAVQVAGGESASPFDLGFDPLYITRV